MVKKAIFFPVLLITFFCFSQEKKPETTAPQLKIEMERFEPPPIGDFNFSSFNIFVLRNGNIYYYYDSTFSSEEEADAYGLDKMNKSFLHKITDKELIKILSAYVKEQDEPDIVLAVEEDDKNKRKNFFKEILEPLKVEEVQLGHISQELLDILKKIK